MSESIEQLDSRFRMNVRTNAAYNKLKETISKWFDEHPQKLTANRGPTLNGMTRSGSEGLKTLEGIFRAFCWRIRVQDEGVCDIDYTGGNNYGAIAFPFEAVAEFVNPGSYIEMSGEQGRRWRWVFDGKTCKQVFPTLVWP